MKRMQSYLSLAASLAFLTVPLHNTLLAQVNPGQGGSVIGRNPNQINPPPLPQDGQTNLNLSATSLIGTPVQDRTGARLGTVKDLALDLQSGRLIYVLVSEVDTAFHPVPPEALAPAAGALTIPLAKNDFNRYPALPR